MPELDIAPAHLSQPHRVTLDYINSVMLYPGDAEGRERAFGAARVQHIICETERMGREGWECDYDTFILVLKFAAKYPPLEQIQEDLKPRMLKGATAGHLLREYIGRSAIMRPGSARSSMSAIKKEISGYSGAMKFSSSTVDNVIWPEYRSVSHLWAAWVEIKLNGGDVGASPCTIEELPQFLATARMFQDIGCVTTPRQSNKGMLLDEERLWCIPRDLELPECEFSPAMHSKEA